MSHAPPECFNASTGELAWKPAQNGGCAADVWARQISHQTVRWAVLHIPLLKSSGISVSVDYIGPLLTTTRGISCILLFTDRFRCCTDTIAVAAAERNTEGTANISVNRYIPLSGCPSTLLSDYGHQTCAQLVTAEYKLLGVHKLTTSSYHPSGNDGVKRVDHTMAEMLATVCS